jgi:hypothetical protein
MLLLPMCLIAPAAASVSFGKPPSSHVLGVKAHRFTIDSKPTFLLGISYYAALGASDETWKRDLDEMQRHGFNWLRVWATWSAFEHDVSTVDVEGRPRAEFLERLKALVAECDRRGMIVDVTLSRGNGITGPPRLQALEAHRRAVETVVKALKPHRNSYLDLSNERNIKDKRFTSFEDLRELRQLVAKLDPERLVTASHAGDIGRDDLREYVTKVRVDFITPHRPRHAKSPAETEAKSRDYLALTRDLGRAVPLHYQEPFRRGFGKFQPEVKDFVADLRGALAAGAAGWCLHNGDERSRADGRPRRSFDLRERRLFEQLDEVERRALTSLQELLSGKKPPANK